MMRGDSVPRPTNPIEGGPVIVPTRRRGRMVAANIVDPNSGEVQFHIVSTKFLNIMVASLVTLLLCGLIVLATVVYLKMDIDQNKEDIEQIRRDGPNDTSEQGPAR